MASEHFRRTARHVGTPEWRALMLPLLVVSLFGLACGRPPASDSASQEGAQAAGRDRSSSSDNQYLVDVRRPSGPPLVELRQPDSLGRVGQVACSTCHSIRPPNLENRRPSDLNEFHQNMPLDHGTLACYACHNPDDSDTLRLADGSVVEYANVMGLCSQCHGAQASAYARGIHGGMTGYWDLSRGGRMRNNCIDCHDPHVPEFPMMRPTFKPRDRFLVPPMSEGPTTHYETYDREAEHE